MEHFSGGLALLSLGIAGFLGVFLIGQAPRHRSTWALVGILLILAFGSILRLAFSMRWQAVIFYMPFVVFPALSLYGPLVYFYTRMSLFKGPPVAPGRRWLFGLPPAIMLGIYAWFFANVPEMRDFEQVYLQTGFVGWFTRGIILLLSSFNLVFVLRAFLTLKKYDLTFEEHYAGDLRSQRDWLRNFLWMNLVIPLVYLSLIPLSVLVNWRLPASPLEGVLMLALLYMVLYYMLKKPRIFALESDLPEDELGKQKKYARQTLKEQQRKNYLERIQNYMNSERPYLDEEFSLKELAEGTRIQPHHVSMTINIELELNFFNFVNSYRMREARRMLQDPSMSGETILNIAFRSGFQSKTAFNRIFKQSEGLTPREYRERLRKSPVLNR